MSDMYNMIFKRKSIRKFNENLKLTDLEIEEINNILNNLQPLYKDIKVICELVPSEITTSKRSEYCVLIYSEKKPNYLRNAGYMLEQLDLKLASMNIGACWYGMGKVKEERNKEYKYVIMMTIGKSDVSDFRKDYTQAKRKNTKDIWKGDLLSEVGDVLKYAPSAVNNQPWRVIASGNKIEVYRAKKLFSIMPKKTANYYNSIDMGIFIYFMELCLRHHNYEFSMTLHNEEEKNGMLAVATFHLSDK